MATLIGPFFTLHLDLKNDTSVPEAGDRVRLEASDGALVMFKGRESHGTRQESPTRGLRQKLIFRWWGGKGVTPFTRAVSRLAPCC
jgi:hypothetical protein